MKTTRRFSSLWMLAAAAVLLFSTGCATTKDVQDIVDTSNAAITVSALSQTTLDINANVGPEAANWEKVIDEINAFVAAHPDQVRTINALRLRGAIVLMNANQKNQARALFNEIDATQLAGARDQTLFKFREAFLWWSRARNQDIFDDFGDAENALDVLRADNIGLGKTDDTRRYLEQMRLLIAVKYALMRSDMDTIEALMKDASDQYLSQFDAAEHEAIIAWARDTTVVGGTTLSNIRWYNFVPTAFNLIEGKVLGKCVKENANDVMPNKFEPKFAGLAYDAFTPAWLADAGILIPKQDKCPPSSL